MVDVFVSYAREDVTQFADAWSQLLAKGLVTGTPWDPAQEIRMGEDWTARIRTAIREASAVVLLWSDAAARSPHINYEIGLANALEKPILIVDLGSHQRLPAERDNVRVIDLQLSH